MKRTLKDILFRLFDSEGEVTYEHAKDLVNLNGQALSSDTFHTYRRSYFEKGERLADQEEAPLTPAEEQHVAHIIKAETLKDNEDFNWNDHCRMMRFAVAVEAVGGIAKSRQLLDDLERFVITLRG